MGGLTKSMSRNPYQFSGILDILDSTREVQPTF